MVNPFDRFYDTPLEVYEAGSGSYEEKGKRVRIGSVVCDIQPYENDTENKMFGLDEQRSYKLYCNRNDLVKCGKYILFGGSWYKIVRAETWSFGMTAVIRGADNEY